MEKNQERISEFEVPEEIIQHIQSFMDDREAARTTLLSKSWYGAWSTRPKLNFDQRYFRKNEFSDFTKKTMQRYEDRNLKIHTFILGITRCKDHSLAAQLILKAIKLGASHLDIQISNSSPNPFVLLLPDEVFQSQTLTRLSLDGYGCTLDLPTGVTTCSNLKSLQLSGLPVTGDIIRDFILRCPLLEEFTLKGLWSSPGRERLPFDVAMLIKLHKLKYLRLEGLDIGGSLSRSDLCPKFACSKAVINSNLKSLNLMNLSVDDVMIRDLIVRCPLIEELTVGKLRSSLRTERFHFDVRKERLHFDVDMLIKLHKLEYLRLENLDVGDSLYRSDLWPKFACLKELVICYDFYSDYEYEYKDVRICSTSLERITIRARNIVNVEFVVPNLKKFEMEGNDWPRLNPSSREWEADVHINCILGSNVRASWFSSLNQLVKMLGRSRLSLSIRLYYGSCDGDGYVGGGLDIPALENLTILGCGASPAFLEALFWSCRPSFVTIERRCVFCIRKVNVEGFPKLRSLPLLEASRGHGKFIRFQLM